MQVQGVMGLWAVLGSELVAFTMRIEFMAGSYYWACIA